LVVLELQSQAIGILCLCVEELFVGFDQVIELG